MKISIRQKAIESELRTFSNFLSNGATLNLKCRNEEAKKKIKTLEKNHMREFKHLRNGIKRKIDTIHKLRKKGTSLEVGKQIEENTSELYTDYRVLEKQERQAVRRINMEERSQFCDFAACIRQVVFGQVAVIEKVEGIKEVLEDMNKVIDDPHNMPYTADEVINDILDSGANYSYDTPTSSIQGSLRGSRCGSLRSISSSVNSRSNSPLCITENNLARTDRSGSVRSYTNSPQNRLSRISLPAPQTFKNADDEAILHPSFYSQPDSEDVPHPTPAQPPSARRSRPSSTCELYSRTREQSSSPARQFRDDNQTFSTIRRTHSPFRKPSGNESSQPKGSTARRPPLPRKHQQATTRPPIPPRSDSMDRINMAGSKEENTGQWPGTQGEKIKRNPHGVETPKCLEILDFINGQKENGMKQPVYINDIEDNEEDLETPTGENQFSSLQHQVCDTRGVLPSPTTGYLTTGPSLQFQQISHKPVSTVAPTIQNKIEHNLWSDTILPHYNSDKILPHDNSDKVLSHNNGDKILPHYNSDKILSHNNSDKMLPYINSDKMLPHNNSGKILSHNSSDKILPHYNSHMALPHCNSDMILPHCNNGKILPHHKSDMIQPHNNSDQILPHYNNDKILSYKSKDQSLLPQSGDKNLIFHKNDNILPHRSGKIDVESPAVSESGRQQIAGLHNSDRKYQLASDKTTDIGNSNQGFKHCYEVTDTRPVLNRSHSVTEQCPGRLSRLDSARRSASMVGRTVSSDRNNSDRYNSDRYNSDRYNSDRQFRDNILHLLTTRLQEKQDNRQDR